LGKETEKIPHQFVEVGIPEKLTELQESVGTVASITVAGFPEFPIDPIENRKILAESGRVARKSWENRRGGHLLCIIIDLEVDIFKK